MKKLTIKLRITLWFTIFMILLSAVFFALTSFISGSTTSHQIKGALTGLINGNMDEIEYDDGHLEIDDDFKSYQNGISCLILSSDGEIIRGYYPYPEMADMSFEDGSIRTFSVTGETYLIYDRLARFGQREDLWVRGIVRESGAYMNSPAVMRTLLTALPILTGVAAIGGYLLAGSSLRPIRKISKTAEAIGSSGDLSKRIEMEGNGDELHQLAATFNRMFDRLESNFEAERQFTSDASHELRTPVTTILAQCEYAFENAAGEDELYEVIGKIQKQGYRMSHLIESLLAFTRLEQRTEDDSFSIIDLSSIISSVCREHQETAERNITLTEMIQPEVKMPGDRTLIIRMFENLLQNAYKYGKENGHIKVELIQNGDQIALSVADDGIGIAPDELPKIWNRFYRIDKARSVIPGNGLGLAMVRQIAAAHGGSAEAVSESGKGSTFTVTFKKIK